MTQKITYNSIHYICYSLQDIHKCTYKIYPGRNYFNFILNILSCLSVVYVTVHGVTIQLRYNFRFKDTATFFQDRIVKIFVLSIVSLELAVSKTFSSDFKVCFHILQSTFWLIWMFWIFVFQVNTVIWMVFFFYNNLNMNTANKEVANNM